jgi:hypothetical protein
MKYLHLKSGRLYEVLNDNVIISTNKDDGKRAVLYTGARRDTSEDAIFVREYKEFMEKFELV